MILADRVHHSWWIHCWVILTLYWLPTDWLYSPLSGVTDLLLLLVLHATDVDFFLVDSLLDEDMYLYRLLAADWAHQFWWIHCWVILIQWLTFGGFGDTDAVIAIRALYWRRTDCIDCQLSGVTIPWVLLFVLHDLLTVLSTSGTLSSPLLVDSTLGDTDWYSDSDTGIVLAEDRLYWPPT